MNIARPLLRGGQPLVSWTTIVLTSLIL